MAVVIGILIGLVAGAVIAAAALAFTGGSRLAAARRTRQLLIQEARQEAETLRREAQLAAKEEAVRLREQIERDLEGRQAEALRARRGSRRRKRSSTGGGRSSSGESRGSPTGRLTPSAAGGVEGREGPGVERARADLRLDRQRGEGRGALAFGGARPPRARTEGAADGGGGAVRGAPACQEPRRRCAPARGGEPCSRDHGLARRAPLRRHEGPDHRPRRTEHQGARAPDRRRHHHRRHAQVPSCSPRSTASAARSRRSRSRS